MFLISESLFISAFLINGGFFFASKSKSKEIRTLIYDVFRDCIWKIQLHSSFSGRTLKYKHNFVHENFEL